MLGRFARWFASAGGVWQTLGAVALAVVLELTHLVRDDHGFWLLYWLTVYSAVTQPVLAYANKQDTRQGDLILARLGELLEHVQGTGDADLEQDTTQTRLLRDIADLLLKDRPPAAAQSETS